MKKYANKNRHVAVRSAQNKENLGIIKFNASQIE